MFDIQIGVKTIMYISNIKFILSKHIYIAYSYVHIQISM